MLIKCRVFTNSILVMLVYCSTATLYSEYAYSTCTTAASCTGKFNFPSFAGPERRSVEIDEKNKTITAYHESGHAIIAYYTKDAMPINKATIMTRGTTLGHVSIFIILRWFTDNSKKYFGSSAICCPYIIMCIEICCFSSLLASWLSLMWYKYSSFRNTVALAHILI